MSLIRFCYGCQYNAPVEAMGQKVTTCGSVSICAHLRHLRISLCQARLTRPPSVSDLPQSVDRFDVVRILGKGGMGTVYLAREQRLDRLVAVKVLHAEDPASEDRRATVRAEARTAAAVRHPNVATIYEVGETNGGVPFIVMEYCDGETLS